MSFSRNSKVVCHHYFEECLNIRGLWIGAGNGEAKPDGKAGRSVGKYTFGIKKFEIQSYTDLF